MTSWNAYTLIVVAQMTTATLLALGLIVCNRRSPTRRHFIGVAGLAIVLCSPLIALVLPQPAWQRLAFSRSPTAPLNEADERARPQPASPDFASPIDGDNSNDVESGKIMPASAPKQPALGKRVSPTSVVRGERPSLTAGNAGGSPWWNRLVGLAGLVWFVGSAFSVSTWLWQMRRLRQLVRTLTLTRGHASDGGEARIAAADENFAAIAREVCRVVGRRQLPPVTVCDAMPIPLVLGVWRPTIVIPRELVQPGAEIRLRDVLIHEAAHVVRRDAWINVAQRVASILWWWHPGVLGLNRTITRSREEVCDNFVLKRSDARQYAQTLLGLAEKCTELGRMVPSLGLLEPRWTLESRIAGLLKPGREVMTRTKRRVAAVVVVLLAAACLLIGGVRAVEGDKAAAKKANGAKIEQAAIARAESDAAKANEVLLEQATVERVESEAASKLAKVVVRGQCVDDKSQPLVAVPVLVLRRSKEYGSHVLVGKTKSDATGHFELRDIGTAMPEHGDLIAIAALRGHVSACVLMKNPQDGVIVQELKLPSNPGTLSGIVKDAKGQPIPGATVYVSCGSGAPAPGIRSSVTDKNGRYFIADLKRWTPESSKTFDPKTGLVSVISGCSFNVSHPDYPRTTAMNTAVPQELNITLYSAAIIQGQVIDAVTNMPAADATVTARGIGRREHFLTHSDAQGHYQLRMTRDHYNIFARTDDRTAVAMKAVHVERGETISNADFRLIRGGFVVGTVFDVNDLPVSPEEAGLWVSHYGPANPRTGEGGGGTRVQADGTYRLRVAPGENYVYCKSYLGMARNATIADSHNVTVDDGQEITLDLHLREQHGEDPAHADELLAATIRRAAEQEDAGIAVPIRQPAVTRVERLLEQLDGQHAHHLEFQDEWCQTMKDLVEIGPPAVPNLIAELDSTNDGRMLSCLGFMLRAINDKRAVPALIRAIRKTLRAPSSDSGLVAKEAEIARFMQEYDLDDRDQDKHYSFGRPVREIFGALEKLTGQSFGEQQLYFVNAGGTAGQERLKQQLFASTAKKWADWWEQHWKEHVQDSAYAHVNLTEAPTIAPATSPKGQAHYKTDGGNSGWVLGSYTDSKARVTFFDLDTGRAAPLPEKWRQAKDIESHHDEIEAWAAHEGFDLMGTEYVATVENRRYYALRPIGLQAWELGKQRWKMTTKDTTFETLQAEGTPAGKLLLHFDREKKASDPKETATFLFKTREGTPGLLFVGIEVQDDTLKPGGVMHGDNELQPVAFDKGRRFGWTSFEEISSNPRP